MAVLKTIKKMGYTQTRQGKELPLYDAMGEESKESAQIIIPRESLTCKSSDIGFRWDNAGRFELIISEYDNSALCDGKFVDTLYQTYALIKMKSEGYKLGYPG